LLNVLVLVFINNDPISVLQSIDKKFILLSVLVLLLAPISKSFGENLNMLSSKDKLGNIFSKGVITLMYHRFEENKYPSTNIKIKVFKEHLKEINKSGFQFIDFKTFNKIINKKIEKNYLLLTIDDGFESFYMHAWPILKEKKIPFILFVSTREVGKHGYMTWKQINEIGSYDFATIGNHSHTHDYMADWNNEKIINDLKTSIKIFKSKIGYSPKIFSYPFGEYSSNFKKIVSDLNFEFAFGQHSGVIDPTKDLLELPRFPVNEKYGELKRFKSILSNMPFPYKKITPENRFIKAEENPPEIIINFYQNLIDVKNINCYSNEGNIWRKSDIKFINENSLKIILKEKFMSERGRINCTLSGIGGKWRWLGIQYTIAGY
jgi:poly-beta-1,6-N-acetyl-D-glucosamine N-deacetylase